MFAYVVFEYYSIYSRSGDILQLIRNPIQADTKSRSCDIVAVSSGVRGVQWRAAIRIVRDRRPMEATMYICVLPYDLDENSEFPDSDKNIFPDLFVFEEDGGRNPIRLPILSVLSDIEIKSIFAAESDEEDSKGAEYCFEELLLIKYPKIDASEVRTMISTVLLS